MADQGLEPEAFIERIKAAAQEETGIRALFVAGSHGRDTADAFSDLDFLAVAAPEDHQKVALAWRRILEGFAKIVFWNAWSSRARILNAITSDWLRCDLLLVGSDGLAKRAQDSFRPLIDRDGIFAGLPASLPPKQTDGARVLDIVNEFIRVLGLLTVAMGRGELYLGVTGAALLRDQLLKLMLEEVPDPDPGGILHPSRVLPLDAMRALEGLPFPGPVRPDLIRAHIAVAREFFPQARILASRLGLAWPEEFEAATRRVLERQLGQEADVFW